MKAHKTRTAIIGALLVVVIILTGTYAWTALNQGAFAPVYDPWNEFGGQYGGRVHHDFENQTGPGHYDSDIYAENFGERNLLVRIQLREYLNINGNPVAGANLNDPSTWPIYRSEANNVHSRLPGTTAYAIGNEGVDWTLGDPTGTKVFMPTFNHATLPADRIDASVPAPFNHREVFRFSNTTGRAVDAIADLFNIGTVADVESIYIEGIQTGVSNPEGLHAYWHVGDAYTGQLIDIDPVTGYLRATAQTHYAQRTLLPAEGGIMTLTQWLYEDRPAGNFWIHDDTDPLGWFYWNGYLPPGEATSLLLHEVYLPDRPEAWEYVITLNADFFTTDSMGDLDVPISDDARAIFNRPEPDNEISQLPDETDDSEESETGDVADNGTEQAPDNTPDEDDHLLALPIAAVGCPQTGTPDNLWTDSTGVEWCAVAEEGDYTMLISRRVHRLPAQDGLTEEQANRHHDTNTFVSWPASTALAGGPEIRGRVNNWWNNNANVSPELRAQAVHTNLRNLNDVLTGVQRDARIADTTMTSLPVAGSSNGLPFFMSTADLNVHLGTTLGARQALDSVSTTVQRLYWLSSAGPNSTEPILAVHGGGAFVSNSATLNTGVFGIRPAVWVRR